MKRALAQALAMTGAALAALVATSQAHAQARVEVGVLTCTARGGTGFIITSTKYFRCRFHRPGRDEYYTGTISKFGLDIGTTKVTSIAWAVLAPTSKLPPRSLSGNYGGVRAEATAGVGVGAHALIGRADRTNPPH